MPERKPAAESDDDSPKRGAVHGFSYKSRGRMVRLIASVPRSRMGDAVVFTTLTYPAGYPVEWERWKRHLDSWWHRIRRKYPTAGAIWKLEPQKRGAPHFHLLIVGLGVECAGDLAVAWYEVVGSGDPWHLKFGAKTVAVKTTDGVAAYVSKYTGKTVDLRELPEWAGGVGRWWGVLSRKNLGLDVVTYPLDEWTWTAAKAECKQLLARRSRAGHRARPSSPWESAMTGLWIILPDTDAMAMIDRLLGSRVVADPPGQLLLPG